MSPVGPVGPVGPVFVATPAGPVIPVGPVKLKPKAPIDIKSHNNRFEVDKLKNV